MYGGKGTFNLGFLMAHRHVGPRSRSFPFLSKSERPLLSLQSQSRRTFPPASLFFVLHAANTGLLKWRAKVGARTRRIRSRSTRCSRSSLGRSVSSSKPRRPTISRATSTPSTTTSNPSYGLLLSLSLFTRRALYSRSVRLQCCFLFFCFSSCSSLYP